MSFWGKSPWSVILVTLLLVSTLIKVLEVRGNNFAFTMDQGRDMVDIRHMVVTLSPRLVGPTTSINGLLLGPFWYYFNLPPFILGGGNPVFIVYWQIIWYQLSVLVLWLVLKSQSPTLAIMTATLLLFMPVGFNTARYFWNANSMVFFTILYLASLIAAASHPVRRNLFVLGLLAGLALQIEAAFGILFFPFALLYLLFLSFRAKPRNLPITSLVAGFGLTLLPQILFEIKHGFIMTRIFLDEFAGKGEMLGEKMSLAQRLPQRWDHLHSLIISSNHLPPTLVTLLFVLSLLFFLFNLRKQKPADYAVRVWSLSFFLVTFSAIFYLLFPQSLKSWYTLGLSVPLVIFLGGFLNYLSQSKSKLFHSVAITILVLTIGYSLRSQTEYLERVISSPSDDRSNLQNELTAIDWVYQNAAGSGFKVYSYLPSVYDFPYNHLFWWYGNRRYGYQPLETAYLPGQPEYIRDVDKLWLNQKALDSKNLTFLIIETDEEIPARTQDWLGHFADLCLLKEQLFPWRARVQMLAPCPKPR